MGEIDGRLSITKVLYYTVYTKDILSRVLQVQMILETSSEQGELQPPRDWKIALSYIYSESFVFDDVFKKYHVQRPCYFLRLSGEQLLQTCLSLILSLVK